MYQLEFLQGFAKDGEEEIRRNLNVLFATRAGSLPGDRDFGINWACLDELPDIAESLFYVEAAEKVERYEPRVEIDAITYSRAEGALVPRICFKRREAEWKAV